VIYSYTHLGGISDVLASLANATPVTIAPSVINVRGRIYRELKRVCFMKKKFKK